MGITETRSLCAVCAGMAPSQPHLPPRDSHVPTYPFQAIAADYFSVRGTKYLVIVDRFSGWPHIMRASRSDEAVGSRGLVRNLKYVFATFGAPIELSSDGGPEFSASETKEFLHRWGVTHRQSSAYNPESNGRAEVAVKSMKRLLQCNTSAEGALDEDCVVAGLLQYRNTPEPTTGMSPALILFGRRLRDRIPIPPDTSVFSNPNIARTWRETWEARETALRLRFGKQMDKRSTGTRSLPPLECGSRVWMQNLCGPNPTKWERTGWIVESLPYDQYLVRMDGSGRITRRNRRHLRQVAAYEPSAPNPLPPCGMTPLPSVAKAAETGQAKHTLGGDTPCPSDPPSATDAPTRPPLQTPQDIQTEHPTAASQVTQTPPAEDPMGDESRDEGAAPRAKRLRRPPAWLNDYITG